MKAVVFDGAIRLLQDAPVPGAGEGEALVRVSMAGICNTDLEIARGYMGFEGVLGHEFVGKVEQGPKELLGQRVVGEINLACGKCSYCKAGVRTHCPFRRVLGIKNKDGAMAEYVTLPVQNLHPIPDGVSDEEAVFVEPLAAAFEILEHVDLMEGDRVLVMGDGKLGLLCAKVLALTPADVSLLGRHEAKLSLLDSTSVHIFKKGREEPEPPYDFVVEATGTAEGLAEAITLLRPRGAVILKSTVASEHNISLAPVVINELAILGSRCGPFSPAIKALSEGLVKVRPMVTATYPIDEAEEAFKKAREKGVLKVLLKF